MGFAYFIAGFLLAPFRWFIELFRQTMNEPVSHDAHGDWPAVPRAARTDFKPEGDI